MHVSSRSHPRGERSTDAIVFHDRYDTLMAPLGILYEVFITLITALASGKEIIAIVL